MLSLLIAFGIIIASSSLIATSFSTYHQLKAFKSRIKIQDQRISKLEFERKI